MQWQTKGHMFFSFSSYFLTLLFQTLEGEALQIPAVALFGDSNETDLRETEAGCCWSRLSSWDAAAEQEELKARGCRKVDKRKTLMSLFKLWKWIRSQCCCWKNAFQLFTHAVYFNYPQNFSTTDSAQMSPASFPLLSSGSKAQTTLITPYNRNREHFSTALVYARACRG